MFVWLSVLMLIAGSCQGLYEDQVFMFDWRKQLIGKIEDLKFISAGVDAALLVRTDKNVLAALDSDDGKLLWRHKFEDDVETGKIWTISRLNKYIVSVSGSVNLFVRIWDPVHGALIQEHYLRLTEAPDFVHVNENVLYLVNFNSKEARVSTFNFDNKKISEAPKKKMAGDGKTVVKCTALETTLTCATKDGLVYTSLKTGTKLEAVPVSEIKPETIATRGLYFQVETSSSSGIQTFKLASGKLEAVPDSASVMLSDCSGLTVSQPCSQWGTDSSGVRYCSRYSDDIVSTFKGKDEKVLKLTGHRGKLESVWSDCSSLADPGAYQLILGFEDGGLVSLTPRGNIMFTREEGLASIQKAEFVSLGFEDTSFKIVPLYMHNENILDPATLAHNFLNRIKRHILQLREFITSLIQLRFLENNSVTLDRFGLNKIIVAVTQHNKLYGIESMSGKILWQLYFPGQFDGRVGDIVAAPQVYLLVQRDGRAGGEAQAALIYKHKHSVFHMLTFDPTQGKQVSDEPINMHLDQALLLPEFSDHEIKPILLIGKDGSAQIRPSSAAECLKTGPPLFVLSNPTRTKLIGSRVVAKENTADGVSLVNVWSLVTPNTEIVSVQSRNPVEQVHSAGRVLADRSVLFKYMNPNLAIVAAQGQDSSAKLFLNIYLLDMVTGKVYYSATHKKVMPPFHTIHSENWAVYSFYNEKARRAELVSIEMYEGKTQTNATVFSSMENKVVPLVEHKAYILPVSDVRALKETVTEQGITSKHLLIGTQSGTVLDLPIHMVDPRRPPLDAAPHLREPGIPPYIPELPMPHESIMNYNQTILGMRDILTSPSGLESTTLVFIHGLDLYGTRITPSKGFDLLKEDFNYLMISAVILGLVLASYITRKLSQNKMLSKAWK